MRLSNGEAWRGLDSRPGLDAQLPRLRQSGVEVQFL